MVQITEEQEKLLENNLIFVVNELDRNMFDIIPKKITVLENFSIGKFLNNITWRQGKIITFFDSNQKKGIDQIKERYDYFFHRGFSDVWLYYLRKLILNTISIQTKSSKELIFINDPHMVFSLEILTKTMPNSRILIILDDEERIVASQMNDFIKNKRIAWVGVNLIDYHDRESVLDYNLRSIIEQRKIIYKDIKKIQKNQYLIISKKKIINKTNEVLTSLNKFLKTEISQDELENIVNKLDSKENIELQKVEKQKIKYFVDMLENTDE